MSIRGSEIEPCEPKKQEVKHESERVLLFQRCRRMRHRRILWGARPQFLRALRYRNRQGCHLGVFLFRLRALGEEAAASGETGPLRAMRGKTLMLAPHRRQFVLTFLVSRVPHDGHLLINFSPHFPQQRLCRSSSQKSQPSRGQKNRDSQV